MRALTLSDFSAQASRDLDRRIAHNTRRRLAYYAQNPKGLADRLEDLDREWDLERAFEILTSSVALAGVALGAAVDRRFLAFPALASACLIQNAAFGWSPLAPLLRNLGFRTADEIAFERAALRALRGDFGELTASEALRQDNRPAAPQKQEPAEARREEPKPKAAKSAAKTAEQAPRQAQEPDEPRAAVMGMPADAPQVEMDIEEPAPAAKKKTSAKAAAPNADEAQSSNGRSDPIVKVADKQPERADAAKAKKASSKNRQPKPRSKKTKGAQKDDAKRTAQSRSTLQ